jgi:hypothetical protein
MWTRLARAWASQGISSLRVDTWGVGDSSGPLVATPSLSTLYADEVHRCYDVLLGWLHDTYRPRHVAAVGLCSGSFMAYRATVRHASVRLAMLVNLPRFDWRPTDEAEVILGSLRGRRLTHEWRRLATGDLEVRRPLAALARAARAKARSWLGGGAGLPAAAAAGVHGVSRRGGRLDFVYSSEDPSLAYADSIFPGGVAALAATRGVRVEEVSGAGHTFMPAWAQDRLTEILTRELTAEPPETEPESGQVGGAPLPAPAR